MALIVLLIGVSREAHAQKEPPSERAYFCGTSELDNEILFRVDDSDTEFILRVKDLAGNTLYDSWTDMEWWGNVLVIREDTDVLGSCDWTAGWESEAVIPAFDRYTTLIFEFHAYDLWEADPTEPARSVTRYTLGGRSTDGRNTFFCPNCDDGGGNQDFFFAYTGGQVKIATSSLKNATLSVDTFIEDFLGNTYIAPYDLRPICDDPTVSCGSTNIADRTSALVMRQTGTDLSFSPHGDVIQVFERSTSIHPPPRTWDWSDAGGYTLRFPASKRLVVLGDLAADDVTLTTSGPIIDDRAQTPWDGVTVYSGGSLDFDGVTVQYAETGVTVYSDDVTITNSAIQNNDVGIESGLVRNYCPGGSPCPSGGLSSFTLEGVSVADNAGIGVLARNAEGVVITASLEGTNTTIHDNGGDGLYLWNAVVTEFLNTFVEENGGIGANVLDNADLSFTDETGASGLDRVANNDAHELFVSAGGYLFLGAGTAGGDNDILDDQAPLGSSNRLIYNEQPCSGMLCGERTVDAEHTWWGSASGPPAGAFGGGPVDYTPYRTSPATSGNRPASSVFAETGNSAGRGDGSWLREAIREARRSLNESPEAEGAGALVKRLYGLQRLDPGDRLGEHAQTMALLSVLRDRLGRGHVPAPLRAAAEAALVAEVHDAVRLGAYNEADGLLRAFAETVEGGEAGRSLALSRVMVEEQAGQYEEALAVLGGVMAEMDAESPMREALAVVAEALARQAGGAEGRPGGSGLASAHHDEQTVRASSEVLGVPYPNPTQAAAVVPLVLSETAEVSVSVYDVLGRRVATLAEGGFEAGVHRLALDASGLPAGVYVIRAAVGDARVFTQRLTVIR